MDGAEIMKEECSSWERDGDHERGVEVMKEAWSSWKMDGFHEAVNSKEENSWDFYPNYVQEFGLCTPSRFAVLFFAFGHFPF